MSLEMLLNELPENASPQEIVQLAWDKYVMANGPTDLNRWVNKDQLPFVQSPIDDILPEDVIRDRQQWLKQAVNAYVGLGEMWRDANKESLLINMNKDEKQKCKDVYISLYPSFQVDAFAFRSFRGDHIILLHHPINDFLYRLMFSIMQMIIGFRFPNMDLLKADLINIWLGRKASPKLLPANEKESLTLFYLMKAATFFILGHEFGHIISGHHGYTDDINSNHINEYGADKIGTDLLFRAWATGTYQDGADAKVKTHPESHYIYGLIAPLVVFGGFSLLNSETSQTHPSPISRMKEFRKYHQSLFPPKNSWSPNDFRQYENSLSIFQDLFTSYTGK